ncbi:MAG: ATP-binding cassette subfamily F protein 3 [Flavobacteriaceae bacterium]|jgi:ATP-binding cassette subfamily F protein 3
MSQKGDTIVRFNEVSFEHGINKPILEEVSFSLRRGSKITLMGQNGAGKSTLFKLLTQEESPEDGEIHISPNVSVAISRQVIPREDLDLTVSEFFQKCFKEKVYDIDPKIDAILEVVQLHAPKEKTIREFSGGQQARLLLASALIQNPDLLLLDEPTNNLDKEGIEHLKDFLIEYKKSVVVISHDAEFLNAFTQGVLYLDIFTRKIEQYVGNYDDVVREITIRVEKEQKKNAQYEKHIQEKKDKANFFANKGGRLRAVAKRMRESAAEAEDSKVDVRREDKTIRPFTIPVKSHHVGELLSVSSLSVMKKNQPVQCSANISLLKNNHLLLKGPNGIGKSTLLEKLATGGEQGAKISDGVVVGYYRQDFSTLDFNSTVHDALASVMHGDDEQRLRNVAAGFLLTGDIVYTKIGSLSEGQKGLVAFAQLSLLQPNLLILDEPTNHINFRHLPIIAKALDAYEGAMILVSHVPEFVEQIRIDETLDLSSLKEIKK